MSIGRLRQIAILFPGLLASIASLWAPSFAVPEDWPTYAHDERRSATTGEALLLPLEPLWVHRPRHPPAPAWPEPAKWDGWHKIHGLKHRIAFDKAFHVAAAGDSVYYGSSAEDKVCCLDAATAAVRWTFYTEGPVRCAPAVSSGRLYFGADDGFVYSLDARDGALRWRRRLAREDRRVAGNERVISLWPVRSGVVVDGGIAYCAAGVFPWEGVYVAALDAETGEETWKTVLYDVTSQGYVLASAARLYMTAGRDRPIVLDRVRGSRVYHVTGGGGGTYALISEDMLHYGPGKTGEISVHKPGEREQLASFRGNAMVVTPAASYLLADAGLAALDRRRYLALEEEQGALALAREECDGRSAVLSRRLGELAAARELAGRAEAKEKPQEAPRPPDPPESPESPPAPPVVAPDGAVNEEERRLRAESETLRGELDRIQLRLAAIAREKESCFLWRVRSDCPLSLILAGDTLFAGGPEKVAAFSTRDGGRIWERPVSGAAYGLAVANGRLFVSTGDGGIHCFQPAAGASGGEREER